MKRITKENYTYFVERFLDGLTTNDEEKALFRWFAKDNIPSEAEKYRDMFRWYSDISHHTRQENTSRINPFVRKSLSIAAAIAFAFTVVSSIWQNISIQREYLCYEGSYVIRDGRKITDPRLVMKEIKAIDIEMQEMKREIEFARQQTRTEIQSTMQTMAVETSRHMI